MEAFKCAFAPFINNLHQTSREADQIELSCCSVWLQI